jgi:hypothetical protein
VFGHDQLQRDHGLMAQIVYAQGPPPANVQAAIEDDRVAVVRWADIYETDNITPWRQNVPMTDGNVSVDMTRGERRNLDMTLFEDGTLGYGPGSLWYDKIIKPYRGIQMPAYTEPGYIYMNGGVANYIGHTRAASGSLTSEEWAVRVTFATPFATSQYFAGRDNGALTSFSMQATTLTLLIKSVTSTGLIIGNATSPVGVPLVYNKKIWLRARVTVSSALCEYWYSFEDTNDFDAVVNWISIGTAVGSNAGAAPRLADTAKVLFGNRAKTVDAAMAGKLHAGIERVSGVTVTEFDPGGVATGAGTFTATTGQTIAVTSSGTPATQVVGSVANVTGDTYVWQLGEFLIDTIGRPHFPHTISISGRDFVKKLQLAKFAQTTSFAANSTKVCDIIQAIALNGGITKFKFANPSSLLNAIATYDRGSARWDACVKLAESINHELFFDAVGNLVLRPFVDPLTAPVSYSFTNASGNNVSNLASYGRATDDNQMFNHVVVYSSNPDFPLVYGEVENNQVSSPTRIAAIGRRTWTYESAMVTTNAQAVALATSFLKVLGLEQYNLNLESFVLPWLEAGDAVLTTLTDAAAGDPTRFLLSSFGVPLGLTTMTANVKRVTIVV